MGLRLPNMYELWRRLSVNIFMVSYRGYGRSQGVPTEEGLKMDADAVVLTAAHRVLVTESSLSLSRCSNMFPR